MKAVGPAAAMTSPDTGLLARKGAARPALRPEDLDHDRMDDAALTLRLDPERQRQLRLVCAREGRSPQQVLVRAFDALIDAIDPTDEDDFPGGNHP